LSLVFPSVNAVSHVLLACSIPVTPEELFKSKYVFSLFTLPAETCLTSSFQMQSFTCSI